MLQSGRNSGAGVPETGITLPRINLTFRRIEHK
jgi:hypothetical protein